MSSAGGDPQQKSAQDARPITVRLHLAGGHTHEVILAEDSADLRQLFVMLAQRGTGGGEALVQLPLAGGAAACTFTSSQIVSIVTDPPVLVRLEQLTKPLPETQLQPEPQPVLVNHPNHVVIENFLTPDEHAEMLRFSLDYEANFEPGSVTGGEQGYRENLVITNFRDSVHSTMIRNRLLVHLPIFAELLDRPIFPLDGVESQLTAANDGHYFKLHSDGGAQVHYDTRSRTISCVYYFHHQPRGFAGGELHLHDSTVHGGVNYPTDHFQTVDPIDNRLVVFPSDAYHEAMPVRCPSRKFADSRFAVTNWFRRNPRIEPETKFGWGYYHCAIDPPYSAE